MNEKELMTSSVDYTESLRNIDNMLSQFEKERQIVIDMLQNNTTGLVSVLWSRCSPICNDKKCLFNMGKTMISYSLDERINGALITNEGVINYYMCPQCKNMSRLIDFNKGGIDRPFYIEYGNMNGEQMIVKEYNITNLYTHLYTSTPKSVSRAINMCTLDKNIDKYQLYKYLNSDPFTNNILINWYIQDKLTEEGIPHIVTMYNAFSCKNSGFSVYENPDIGTMRHLQEHQNFLIHQGKPSPTAKMTDTEPLSKDIVKGVIYSLFSTLKSLQKYKFSHGCPSSKNILFKDTPCSYLHDGVHIECPITLQITDFSHSGITINNNLRIYTRNIIADEIIQNRNLNNIIDTVVTTPYSGENKKCNKTTFYKLKDPYKYLSETIIYKYIKSLGLPIYLSSFDIYAWMIVLMTEKSFYETLMNDKGLYKLWRNMWLPREFESIQTKIVGLHSKEDPTDSTDKVLKILSGLCLRYDMIDHGWNIIKTLN